MELMVSAALFPSLFLCLCCLWYQMRSYRKATRKIGDAKIWAMGGRRRGGGLLPTSYPATRSTRSMSGTKMGSRGRGGAGSKARGKGPPPRPSSRRVGVRRQTRGQ